MVLYRYLPSAHGEIVKRATVAGNLENKKQNLFTLSPNFGGESFLYFHFCPRPTRESFCVPRTMNGEKKPLGKGMQGILYDYFPLYHMLSRLPIGQKRDFSLV